MIAIASKNIETALNFALSGYSVFPCHAGGEQAKRPMPFIKWREASTTDAGKIRQWWAKWPEAAIGLDLAKCGFIVIDCDRHGSDDGVEAFGQLAAAHNHNIDASPLVATPKEGSHIYFRQPETALGNARGTLPAGVDVRGAGGYVIAPGTVMADGRVYELFGNLSSAPVLPEWLISIIGSSSSTEVYQPVQIVRQTHSDTRINAYCEAAIAAEISRVETAPQGGRNNTLNEAAFALGQLVGAGWKSEAEISALLANAAAICGLPAVESRKTIQSGIRAGAAEPRELPPDDMPECDQEEAARIAAKLLDVLERRQRSRDGTRQVIEMADGVIADAETGEVIETILEDDENIGGASEYYDLPDEKLKPPGLVGDIVEWICETTGEPIRIHALGAALVAVGTIIARKVYSQKRPSGTHLYIGAIAPSGLGKDHPQACIQLLLDQFIPAQGHSMHISSFPKSDAKLGSLIYERPASVMIVDEFASKLALTKSRNASTHATAITEVLLELWGRNQRHYEVPSAITRSEMKILRPAFSFYGASTLNGFKESLLSKDVTSGLYNRFLFLPRHTDIPIMPEKEGELAVPERIATQCKWLYQCLDDLQTSLARRADGYPSNPIYVPFSAEAEKMNEKNRIFQRSMQKLADQESALALYGRYAEQIKRIAMIIACGRSPVVSKAIITESDMTFAQRLVRWSIEQTVLMVRRDMVENWIEANRSKVISLVRSKKVIERSKVLRIIRNIKGKDLDEILNYLKQADCIEEFKKETPGRPVTYYRYVRG